MAIKLQNVKRKWDRKCRCLIQDCEPERWCPCRWLHDRLVRFVSQD